MVWVKELAARQPDRTSLIKGPPADRAFDSAGQPTKAVEGFARSRGISVTELQIREMDGRRYASAVVSGSGRPAPQVHSTALSSWVGVSILINPCVGTTAVWLFPAPFAGCWPCIVIGHCLSVMRDAHRASLRGVCASKKPLQLRLPGHKNTLLPWLPSRKE